MSDLDVKENNKCAHEMKTETIFEYKFWKDEWIPGHMDSFREYGEKKVLICQKCKHEEQINWRHIGPVERRELDGGWWDMQSRYQNY